MALLMVTERAASSSTLLGRALGGGRHPSAATAPFSSRSVHHKSDGGSGQVTDQPHEFTIENEFSDSSMRNPLQKSGPEGAYEVKQVEEGLLIRMEMPGIGKEDVKVWADNDDNIFVKAEEKMASKYEESARTYSAKINVQIYGFYMNGLEAETKNGVLRMLIPTLYRKWEVKMK